MPEAPSKERLCIKRLALHADDDMIARMFSKLSLTTVPATLLSGLVAMPVQALQCAK